METIVVALVGQPNVGKSSLINAISGAHLKVGNFAGVTVEKTEISVTYGGYTINIIDLPGIYALNDFTIEEKITKRFLEHEHYDLILNVLDCTNLERNLTLTTQLLNRQHKILIALNMWDEACKEGLEIDTKMLSKTLGAPCISTSAHTHLNTEKILEHLITLHQQAYTPPTITYSPAFKLELNHLAKQLNTKPLENLHAYLNSHNLSLEQGAYLLLEQALPQSVLNPLELVIQLKEQAEKRLCHALKEGSLSVILNQETLKFSKQLAKQVCKQTPASTNYTKAIDKYLMHEVYGIPIFLALMFLVFSLSFLLGGGLQGFIETGFTLLSDYLKTHISNASLGSLLGDGIIGGVGAVLSFLPLIMVLYLGISLLEATGYMSRVAFLLDGIFHKFGLHGKSFIPLVTGFGCSVPAYMATRTLQNQHERLITLFVIGFMSCSARLPIYVLFVGTFFPDKYASFVLFMIYITGALVALFMAKFLKLSVFRGQEESFVMEMPKYRMPSPKVIWMSIYTRSLSYLKKAGTYILAGALLIWFASQYPKDPQALTTYKTAYKELKAHPLETPKQEQALNLLEENLQKSNLEYSLVGRIGQAIHGVFKPMDFNWQLSISLVTGFMAKEVVVSTLGVLYSLGNNPQDQMRFRKTLAQNVSLPSAIAFIVFIMFYIPCFAATITFGKEAGGTKFVLYLFVFTTAVAYIFSLLAYYVTQFCVAL
ncbi:ferrous iron transport protein B [Helicobacter suis]|uniref:ferrous iron transport protein B n=1 Tax=Helicobacter suis TaxID=104628 RepID=UPI0013D27C20|nr:ferrous iron transport protein B [Helicobacter suis]